MKFPSLSGLTMQGTAVHRHPNAGVPKGETYGRDFAERESGVPGTTSSHSEDFAGENASIASTTDASTASPLKGSWQERGPSRIMGDALKAERMVGIAMKVQVSYPAPFCMISPAFSPNRTEDVRGPSSQCL